MAANIGYGDDKRSAKSSNGESTDAANAGDGKRYYKNSIRGTIYKTFGLVTIDLNIDGLFSI